MLRRAADRKRIRPQTDSGIVSLGSGALLERVYGDKNNVEGITSPTGVVPEWTRKVPGEVKAA